jgi:hypothetical protein
VVVLVVLLAIPIVGVGATEVDGEATVVVTMAPLDLVGNRCLRLVFIMVPVSLGLVGSSIPVKFLTPTKIFKMLNVNCVMVLGIQQNTVLNLPHSICRLLLTWHFRILNSPLQVGFLIRVLISM